MQQIILLESLYGSVLLLLICVVRAAQDQGDKTKGPAHQNPT
jgi:hypothetical protein